MTQRNKVAAGLLAVTLALFVYIVYQNSRPQTVVVPVSNSAVAGFVPLAVENPALRLDLLEQLKQFQYEGPRRNIFTTGPAAVDAPVQQTVQVPIVAPPTQIAGPPPLVVPATFFGRVTDRNTGARRALFSAGEDVYVLGLGEVLMNRFRLVQIGDTTAEMEEVASGRRTTLTMEQPSS